MSGLKKATKNLTANKWAVLLNLLLLGSVDACGGRLHTLRSISLGHERASDGQACGSSPVADPETDQEGG